MLNKLVSLHVEISNSTVIIRGSKMKGPTVKRRQNKVTSSDSNDFIWTIKQKTSKNLGLL